MSLIIITHSAYPSISQIFQRIYYRYNTINQRLFLEDKKIMKKIKHDTKSLDIYKYIKTYLFFHKTFSFQSTCKNSSLIGIVLQIIKLLY